MTPDELLDVDARRFIETVKQAPFEVVERLAAEAAARRKAAQRGLMASGDNPALASLASIEAQLMDLYLRVAQSQPRGR